MTLDIKDLGQPKQCNGVDVSKSKHKAPSLFINNNGALMMHEDMWKEYVSVKNKVH